MGNKPAEWSDVHAAVPPCVGHLCLLCFLWIKVLPAQSLASLLFSFFILVSLFNILQYKKVDRPWKTMAYSLDTWLL